MNTPVIPTQALIAGGQMAVNGTEVVEQNNRFIIIINNVK